MAIDGIVLAPYSALQPKQDEFLDCSAKFKLMGGSNGGGKSYAFRAEAFRSSNIVENVKGLVLRRTREEVKKNFVNPMLEETRVRNFDGTLGQSYMRFVESKNVMLFPNRSRIDIGYCETQRDVRRYQGLEYDWIGIEELTQWKEEWFRMIMTSLRTTRAGVRPFFMGSCNPGDIGHAWVKRLYISRSFHENENPEDYGMIRANVWDNPILLKADPEYLQNLMNLDEKTRRARLYGDWDVFEGQFFNEYREAIHVIDPFFPQIGIKRRIVAIDYGYKNPSAVLWMAQDTQGFIYVYRELYCTNLLYEQLAAKIAAMTREDEKIDLIVVDPAALEKKSESTGTSMRDGFIKVANKTSCEWLKKTIGGNNNRADGWGTVRKGLQVFTDPNSGKQTAMVHITRNCENLIRTLPDQVHDERNVEDMNSKGEAHACDALRYGLMELGISITSMTDVKSSNEALKKSSLQGMTPKEKELRSRGITHSKSILDKQF